MAERQTPVVFLSHITEEAVLASMIRKRIEDDFLDMIRVFQSSDRKSIQLGDKWLSSLSDSLVDAKIVMLLCSPMSVTRPWINFEAGAGWVKDVPVIPICHSGMRRVGLPLPLNMLQASEITNPDDWVATYETLAKQLGSKVPKVDFSRFIADISTFEAEYTVVRVVRESVNGLIAVIPALREVFRPGTMTTRAGGEVAEAQLTEMKPHLESLRQRGMVDYASKSAGMAMGENFAAFMHELNIDVLEPYYRIADKVMDRSR